MAKVKYRSVNFHGDSRTLIGECNTIIEDYQAQGFRLTLRQLYYQLVTKNLITNEEKSYKKMSSLLTDARYAIIARENEDKALLRDATDKLMNRDRQAPPWVDHDPGFDDDDEPAERDGEPADPDVFVDPDGADE